MTILQYKKLFREKAVEAGFSESNITKCLNYALPLIQKELPVIFNTSNLASLVGYNRSYLKRAVQFTPFFYRKFKIKKKNGKLREIAEPLPSLKNIQLWILKEILYQVPISKFTKAYVPKKSIINNVKFHKDQKQVLCMDISDFFPCISVINVEKLFRKFGYSDIISNLLAKLCCLDGYLPQGAPTSPYLSNLYLYEFDNEVADYCVNQNIRFTRYADDLTFSGDFNVLKLKALVEKLLREKNLTVNKNKTRLMSTGERQIVTGIVVNKKLQVSKKHRKNLRQEIYYIKKFGLEDHLKKIECKRAHYLKHLLGIANYMLFINPNDTEVKNYKETITGWLNTQGMQMT